MAAYQGLATIGEMDPGMALVVADVENSDLRHIVEVRNSWTALVGENGSAHIRLIAKAVAAGAIREDDDEDWESEYERSWKQDVLRGTGVARNEQGEAKWQEMKRVLEETIEARLAANIDAATRHRIEHPEDHVRILESWAKVVWMKRWPFQKLFSRAIARERHVAHFAGLAYEDSVRVRASLGGPLTSAPLLCVPFSAARSFTNDEFLWYNNQRLGKTQPSTLQLNPNGDAVCTCAARKPIEGGHHLRVCRLGGGHIVMHNIMRDLIHGMCANAGVVARTEVPGLLHDGNERPGDVVATGIGRDGEDLCIDCCVMDPLAGLAGLSMLMRQQRTWQVAHSAAVAEKDKRAKKRAGEPNGLTMEQRVRAIGKTFYPVGFEVFGATTASCIKLIKKLSEKAHERRGHDKATFVRYWTTEIAMCLAKRGAQVALARTFSVSAENRVGFDVGGEEDGPMGAPDAEQFIGDGED